jgi:inner membrane protein
MHRLGHYGAALICYSPIAAVLITLGAGEMALAGGAIVVGGAMLPDYDQRVPGISHRGPTHTVWFALAVGAVLGAAGGFVGNAVLGVVGAVTGMVLVVAHLLADALTPMGIRPFAPASDRQYTLDLVKASSTVGNYFLLVAGIVAAAAALYTGRLAAGVV